MMDAKTLLTKVKAKKSTKAKTLKPPDLPSDPSFDRTFESISKNWEQNEAEQKKVQNTQKIRKKPKKSTQEKLEKTSDKVATKWRQTSDKVATKAVKNWRQTGDKVATKTRDKTKSGDKVATELATKVATNWRQTGDKVATKTHFSALTGLQKKLTEIIFEYCIENASDTTAPIAISHLSQVANSPIRSVKRSIQRLSKKNVLFKSKNKNGRGGWTQYRIEKNIHTELLRMKSGDKVATKWRQSSDKVATELATELATSSPSSSSYINKETTTTQTDKKNPFKSVIIPEKLRALGFGESHLLQLEKLEHLSLEKIQTSLDHLAFDLNEDKLSKIKTNPINFLMGILRKGEYVSADYTQEAQSEIDEHLAQLKQRKSAREEKKRELEQLLFDEWIESKTDEDLMAIEKAPLGEVRGLLHLELLKLHFVEKEMVSFRQKFSKETSH